MPRATPLRLRSLLLSLPALAALPAALAQPESAGGVNGKLGGGLRVSARF